MTNQEHGENIEVELNEVIFVLPNSMDDIVNRVSTTNNVSPSCNEEQYVNIANSFRDIMSEKSAEIETLKNEIDKMKNKMIKQKGCLMFMNELFDSLEMDEMDSEVQIIMYMLDYLIKGKIPDFF